LVGVVAQLKKAIEQLDAVKSTNAKATELLAKSKATVEALKASQKACEPVLEAIRKADLSRPIPLVGKLAPRVSDCSKALAELAKKAGETKAQATKLADTAELRELLQQVEQALATSAGEALDTEALAAVLNLQGLVAPMKDAQWADSADFRDAPLGALVDTRIELPTTPRKVGDYVTYQGQLRDRKEDAALLEGPQRSLKVVSTGLRLNVSGSLIFVQPTARADNEDPFRAAPALTAAFHYYCGRKAGQTSPTGGCALWNGFNPGLGIHAATITLGKVTTDAAGNENARRVETPHVGVAGVAQLFGDVLQAGAGYDFQAGRAYWCIGLGIQTLTKLGFDFGI
jgi:hypothetical protein